MDEIEFVEGLIDKICCDWETTGLDHSKLEELFNLNNGLTFMIDDNGNLTGYAIQVNSYPKIQIVSEPGETYASIVYRGACGEEVRRTLSFLVGAWIYERVRDVGEERKMGFC